MPPDCLPRILFALASIAASSGAWCIAANAFAIAACFLSGIGYPPDPGRPSLDFGRLFRTLAETVIGLILPYAKPPPPDCRFKGRRCVRKPTPHEQGRS